MGTPDFAVTPLAALLAAEWCTIVGVVTNPDKPAGRGQKILSSAVKQFAEAKGLPILQPSRFRDEQFLEDLHALQADLQVVVAFKMLPEVVWNMPPLGTVNLHASLLPQYRGAAPINHAIINGEITTGVTTFLLQHEIDTGNILLQKEISIANDETAGTLHDKLMNEGAKLLVETVKLLAQGDYTPVPQSEVQTLKAAPKIFKEDCSINWRNEGQQIYKFICGLSPYPTAWTIFSLQEREIIIKIYECEFEKTTHKEDFATLKSDGKNYLKVPVKNGYIIIKKLQQAGKRAMLIEDFLRGFPIEQAILLTK